MTKTAAELAALVASRINGQGDRRYSARVWTPSKDGLAPRVYISYRTHKLVECGYLAIEADGRVDPRAIDRDIAQIFALGGIDMSARTVAD